MSYENSGYKQDEIQSSNPVYVHSQEEHDLMRSLLPSDVPVKLIPVIETSLESVRSLDLSAPKPLENES